MQLLLSPRVPRLAVMTAGAARMRPVLLVAALTPDQGEIVTGNR